jgi:hypothetical protein
MIDVEYAVRTHDVGKVVTVMCTFLEKTADTSTHKLSVYVDIFLLLLPHPNIIGSRSSFAGRFSVIYELLICIDRYSGRRQGGWTESKRM